MSLTPLPAPWLVETPKGKGYVMACIDYSQEHDLIFVVFQQNREIWMFRSHECRAAENITLGRVVT